MKDPVHLHGYRYSVYTRTARLALLLKEVPHETFEVDPFAELPRDYLSMHPFGRVPALTHGTFELFETSAITRYVDRAFEGPPLQPERAAALARMDQVVAVVDAYAYWPMVRQVASHAFFRPLFGEAASREEVHSGLAASRKVLSFLDRLAGEGDVLTGRHINLADCHLAPMMDYFVKAEEGKDALFRYPKLHAWWDRLGHLPILKETAPLGDQPTRR